ncbi:D-aminoacyl-tRNA deacylase 1-like [Oncorhynchus masou masou]|uniref:D-aminoacyl-tRNA deacylase 1-like n=1 Tax=Oncorhynchus masou masou TaxID=90313 RepID=UPI0031842685
MKAIIQRVTTASVSVGEVPISSIGRGLCVLLGISMEYTQTDVDYMVRKILNLRLFDDENGRAWSKSVMDREYAVYNYITSYGQFGAYMQVHIQNDGPVTIELVSPSAPMDPKQLAKQEKQQQRKEKQRSKGPSESGRERAAPRPRAQDPNASSGADGDVSSERETYK